MHEFYIGLMSGTSLDGVDAVLLDLEAAPRVLAHAYEPFDAGFRAELLALNTPGAAADQGGELHRAALAANRLARIGARTVAALLERSGVAATEVRAIGSHGQTVRHRPQEFDGCGYTLQLDAPALLAELSGIDVAADFRSRDVAAGGQGAPLVPAFHQAVFARPDAPVGVLNIGGISNLTLLPAAGDAGQALRGFDCGPGNALMDHWCALHLGRPYDADGAWAASGRVVPRLLDALLADPYFALPPPKSTGRDRFHAQWLSEHLSGFEGTAPEDVQATLAELTARCCAAELRRHAPDSAELIVCGGGALNGHLMRRLAAALPGTPVLASDTRGLPPLQVEAAAFAWLARELLLRRPAGRPDVTGARGARVLGALYPR
ncbi:anhydro-N-acetylmuramic acid kinase [Caldimonas tepidiphila]|uniref:anhydro-N-acetylmuramic acid kinase n=1 Tax=Caldimonas tepidiphila TaxID=2315841 RepID=UPI000E5B5C90|nr:anhydro-N-acetylmuramic acid kinase [Caldimonas tepidiphila]